MKTQTKCDDCGAALDDTRLSGECPTCLIQLALDASPQTEAKKQ